MTVLISPVDQGESFEVLSTLEVVREVQERVPWPKFHENYLKKLQDKEKFPAPWISIGGRKGWLRPGVDAWIEQESVKRREQAIQESVSYSYLAGLKGRELDKALAEIKKRIQAGQ